MNNRLILNSSFSIPFSLGSAEKLVPLEHSDRIIRFAVDKVDKNGLVDHMKDYDNILKIEGKSTSATGNFLLDKFFEHVRNSGLVDSLEYVEGENDQIWQHKDLTYKFINGGRTINVKDSEDRMITEIGRLVTVKKDNYSHAIVCDIRACKNPKTNFNQRIRSARDLIPFDCTLSYMLVLTSDSFKRELSTNPEQRPIIRNSFPRAKKYLDYSRTNLYLVYSCGSPQITQLGQNALREIEQAVK